MKECYNLKESAHATKQATDNDKPKKPSHTPRSPEQEKGSHSDNRKWHKEYHKEKPYSRDAPQQKQHYPILIEPTINMADRPTIKHASIVGAMVDLHVKEKIWSNTYVSMSQLLPDYFKCEEGDTLTLKHGKLSVVAPRSELVNT